MKGLTSFLVLLSLNLSLAKINPLEDFFEQRNIKYLKDALNGSNSCWAAVAGASVGAKMKMYDASTKVPSGVLNFVAFDLGNFDECYNLEEVINDETVYGKYCLGTIPIPKDMMMKGASEQESRMLGRKNIGYHLAYCLLSPCSAEDFSLIPLSSFDEQFCYSKATKPELDGADITAIVIFGIFGVIVVLSTAYDLYLFYTESKPSHPLQVAFSLWTNGQKVFKTSSGGDQLSCINGIKALSMMWVIYGHENSNMEGAYNYLDVMDFMKDKKNMYLLNAPVSVDTFFTVAGLLTMYTFLKAHDKGVKFSLPMYYVHRYLRLTPALAVIVLLNATLTRFMGEGPLWGSIDMDTNNCRNYWWSTLLYVQNYVSPEEMCVGQSWYLSVDTQLYALSPIVLLLLVKYPKIGLATLGGLVLAGNIVPFVITYTMELPATLASTDMDVMMDYIKYYYFATYSRFGPYVIGMAFGWIIYNLRKNDSIKSMEKGRRTLFVITTWIVALVGLVVCLYAGASVVTEEETGLVAKSFYNGSNRNGWAVAVCLVIVLCTTGYGGPIDSFLSIPLFQILSKLSYSMYLVHYTLIVTKRYLSAKVLFYFSVENVFHAFFGDFMITLIYAFFLCTIFESPIITVEKVIFGDHKKSSEKPKLKSPA